MVTQNGSELILNSVNRIFCWGRRFYALHCGLATLYRQLSTQQRATLCVLSWKLAWAARVRHRLDHESCSWCLTAQARSNQSSEKKEKTKLYAFLGLWFRQRKFTEESQIQPLKNTDDARKENTRVKVQFYDLEILT
jgi:hypothetical protein